jgi:zinc protease
VVVVVVGDFDRARVLADLRRGYGDWAAQSGAVEPVPEPPQTAPRSRTVPWPAPTSPRVLVGWRVPGFSTADTTSAAVRVSAELAFGKVGAAYRQLVVEERAIEDLDIWSWPHRDAFLLVVAARLRPGADIDRVERALQDAASALAQRPEEALEGPVAKTRSHLLFDTLLGLESPRDLANAIVFHATASGEPRAFERHLERLATVSASDVRRVAASFFVPEQRTTIRLGSFDATADNADPEGEP